MPCLYSFQISPFFVYLRTFKFCFKKSAVYGIEFPYHFPGRIVHSVYFPYIAVLNTWETLLNSITLTSIFLPRYTAPHSQNDVNLYNKSFFPRSSEFRLLNPMKYWPAWFLLLGINKKWNVIFEWCTSLV